MPLINPAPKCLVILVPADFVQFFLLQLLNVIDNDGVFKNLKVKPCVSQRIYPMQLHNTACTSICTKHKSIGNLQENCHVQKVQF